MQIEVMSLRGSQWLQLFLEQAQIGQMVEHILQNKLIIHFNISSNRLPAKEIIVMQLRRFSLRIL